MDIGDVTVDQRGVSLWVIRLTGEHDLVQRLPAESRTRRRVRIPAAA